MPKASEDAEFIAYLLELMQSLGKVSAKRMFGGSGFFLDGLMFALVTNGTLYFKTDKKSEHAFLKRGLGPFTYYRKEKQLQLNYYQAPEEALEDNDEMHTWATQAFEVALRQR